MRELRRPSGRLHLLALACVALGGAADDWSHCEELLELASRGGASVELPTVVLVGHRNDGKSSLLEALLGLKLTHVGHDEATRRPLEIRAQRDEAAAEPAIFLTRDGQEERVTAEVLRSYLEAENARLEEAGVYEAEPVRVRLLWRRAPTLVLIDTPGLIGATDSEALATLNEHVERLVLRHISPPNRLILCLEDTSDWATSRTMHVIEKVDVELRRTVLVATKLDAKMAQARLRTRATEAHPTQPAPACTRPLLPLRLISACPPTHRGSLPCQRTYA